MIFKKTLALLFLSGTVFFLGVAAAKNIASVKKENFGKADGKNVEIYTMTNRNGVEVKITTYGATVVSLKVPDRNGKFEDVVLGFDTLDDYLKGTSFFGSLIGRYGNRLAGGRFKLNGVEYKLATNNGPNHLHGGNKGFDKVVWNAKPIRTAKGTALELRYLSRDGEEGYPGNLSVVVIYALNNQNELRINYSATTNKDTIINLTHHSYFNLAGEGNGDVLKHELTISGDHFTPVDSGLIPTGELRSVKGTPFDFAQPTAIGARIGQSDEQLKIGNGYDHNWVVNGRSGTLRQAAKVFEPTTGRAMEVWTTEPGMQFYTGNFLDGSQIGKGGKPYQHRYGFCLETQHYPDSPNKPAFPTTVLRTSGRYRSTTVYKFSTRQ
jgi:aldose 1-epimerase